MVYFITALIILSALVAFMLAKTMFLKPKKYSVPYPDDVAIDAMKAAEHLSDAVKFKTVSNTDPEKTNWDEFDGYVGYLERTFPLTRMHLHRETINGHSLLYIWEGRDRNKKPALFAAHMDVVPAEESGWSHPPFGGVIDDGFVWGRGTLDIKVQMIAILEAVEYLLGKNYVPERDIYIAFGHDEEIGGREGASRIAERLGSRGIKFEYVVDEGGCVNEGAIPGISSPIALIGIAEKGFANIQLTAKNPGGHSSTPPQHTSVGIIAKAIADLESHQCSAKLNRGFTDMMEYIGPEMKPLSRFVIANRWLFSALIEKAFASFPQGNAIIRTTTAATMVEGGNAANVLPQSAKAVINFRIAPGETSAELIRHIKNVIRNDEIEITPLIVDEPSIISNTDTFGFNAVRETLCGIFPGCVAAPYIVLGGTDARRYQNVCQNIYRISPYQISNDDLGRIHGQDERISIDNVGKAVAFFVKMMKK